MHRNFFAFILVAMTLFFSAPVFADEPVTDKSAAENNAVAEWAKKTVVELLQSGAKGLAREPFDPKEWKDIQALLDKDGEALRKDMDKWQGAAPSVAIDYDLLKGGGFLPDAFLLVSRVVEFCHDAPPQEKTGYEMEECLDVHVRLPPENAPGKYWKASVSHEVLAKLRHAIGSLGVGVKDAGGYFLVSRVFDELHRQKNPMKMLLRGDVLLEIDGASVSGLSLGEADKKIFGAPGSDVTVHVRRSEVSNDLELKLTRINMSDQEALYHAAEALPQALAASSDVATGKKTSVPPFFIQTSWDELQAALKDEGPRLSKILPDIVRKPAWCTIFSKDDPHIPQSWDFSCVHPLPDTSDDDVVFGRDREVLSFTLSRVPEDQSLQGLAVTRFKSGLVPERRIAASSICKNGDTGAFQRDKFGGVGIGNELESCVFRASHLYEGMPAERAGVKEGDLVVAVDGVPLMGLTLQEMMTKVRGEPGTDVTLTVLRKHEKDFLTFKIKREIITVP